MHEVNLIHKNVSKEDRELLLGPFEKDDGPIIEFGDECTTMAHLMHLAECFKSIGDARKNGWNKPIPNGYQQFTFGKKRLKIYILNEL
jgi:hypothetical protein